MLSAFALSGYSLPLPDLAIGAISERNRRHDRLDMLVQHAETIARWRHAAKEQSDRFKSLYEHAERLALTPTELDELAEALLLKERELAAQFLPRRKQLELALAEPKSKVNTPSMRSWRRTAEEMIEIGMTWLELYQNVRLRLLKLASDRLKETESDSGVLTTDKDINDYLDRLIAR
jgi:hypothetical protein